jgi:RNA polymerase sigma factor (sigma-70 family)
MKDRTINPFVEDRAGDEDDAAMAAKAAGGDRDALERLVRRHQAWLYNIAVRMVCDRSDAEDVTQEVLLKVVTKLSTFQGRSGFRTWLYRIASNHVLNMRRRPMERDGEAGFGALGLRITSLPDHDLPDPNPIDGETAAVVNETRIRCTTGMLLCLDRRQRLAFILSDSLGVDHAVGAAVMEVSPDNFRQLLSRARRDLFEFMQGHCGLVNEANPCRCAKKTRAMIEGGQVDPDSLRFLPGVLNSIERAAPAAAVELKILDERYTQIFRTHPLTDSPDQATWLRGLLAERGFVTLNPK